MIFNQSKIIANVAMLFQNVVNITFNLSARRKNVHYFREEFYSISIPKSVHPRFTLNESIGGSSPIRHIIKSTYFQYSTAIYLKHFGNIIHISL